MNVTQRAEEQELEALFEAERNQPPRYPIIEKPEAAQLGRTAINFTPYNSEGTYIEVTNG